MSTQKNAKHHFRKDNIKSVVAQGKYLLVTFADNGYTHVDCGSAESAKVTVWLVKGKGK